MDSWDAVILSILNEQFFVKVIHIDLFDSKDCCKYAAAEVMGKKENVQMAEYVLNFLRRTLQSLWGKHEVTLPPMNGTQRRSDRRTYFLGVLRGFRLQLEKTREECFRRPGVTESECKALVLTADKELGAFVKSKYPRTSKTGGTRINTSSPAYQAGKNDGAKIRLNRPITGHDGNRGLLLS